MMKNFSSKIILFFGLWTLFLLFGCGIETNIYMQNLTNETKMVTIKYIRQISRIKSSHYQLKYIDSLEPVKFFNYKNEKKLKVLEQKVYDSMIVITLPARSTSRIEQGSNYNWHSTIDYVEIDNYRYSVEELQAKLGSVKKGFFLKIE